MRSELMNKSNWNCKNQSIRRCILSHLRHAIYDFNFKTPRVSSQVKGIWRFILYTPFTLSLSVSLCLFAHPRADLSVSVNWSLRIRLIAIVRSASANYHTHTDLGEPTPYFILVLVLVLYTCLTLSTAVIVYLNNNQLAMLTHFSHNTINCRDFESLICSGVSCATNL